jgi:hypothetical protein
MVNLHYFWLIAAYKQCAGICFSEYEIPVLATRNNNNVMRLYSYIYVRLIETEATYF